MPSPPVPPTITPSAYVEAYYAYNFDRPSNGITNDRGFDNRSNSITLSNAVIGAAWQAGDVSGKVAFQIGSTPSTYYASEPALAGASGANATGSDLWKYVQEANVGWKAPIGRGLLLQAGLFLSPIGPEGVAVKDNWNWSRSNLFFALPFYHAGARASYEVVDGITLTGAVYNGWNNVVDDNDGKSLSTSVGFTRGIVSGQVLYFGGAERPASAPEGPYFRHDFDTYVKVDATSWLSLMVHGNAGFEPNRFGTSSWEAGALYARVHPLKWLAFAVRSDRFHEEVGANASGSASPIFFPVSWMASQTATIEFLPADFLSARIEARHDQADGFAFFSGDVHGDGSASAPFVANARAQNTITFGVTSWFP